MSKDYIDRTDIEFPYMSMSMWGINSATCRAYNEGVKAAEDAIMSMPVIDVPDTKVGEWVYNPNGMDWGLGAWECSLCKCKNDNLGMSKEINPYLFAGGKYCPHCGARMENFSK